MPKKNISTIRRLSRRVRFLCEIDKVKSIRRHTLLMDGSRRENDAEHAWHLAIMAVVVSDLAATRSLDVLKVLTMVLIHDIVEIDCGDAFLYDARLRAKRKKQEARAAKRIFGLLPRLQAHRFLTLWNEFEARATPEAQFAAALDRFQPILHNIKTGGRVWKKAGVSADQVLITNRHIADGAPLLWDLVRTMVERGKKQGFFGKGPLTGRTMNEHSLRQRSASTAGRTRTPGVARSVTVDT
ncbi:MAG: HD domain-containing protein [Chitinispirillaceae bacterium]|nr:HD domain-containing protein [Chitinispirillaceae bacterium]